MNRAITATKPKPVAGATVPFAKASEAFQLTERGDHFGKISVAFAD